MAIQIVKQLGGIPIAVVSSDDKFDFCMKLGAKGCINRKEFDHWGMLPHWTDNEAFGKWVAGRARVRREVLGGARRAPSPRIVFEHPGEDTVPTSIFVCDTGGMVVICAGTSGYNADGRPALPVDAPEAVPGLALRERRAGERVQPAGAGRQVSTRASARRTPSRTSASATS